MATAPAPAADDEVITAVPLWQSSAASAAAAASGYRQQRTVMAVHDIDTRHRT